MGKETKIEWCDATWNPWRGCTPVSPGCDNCYAARGMKRWGHDPQKIVRAADATFYAPLKWKEPKRIFVCSWSDFFHDGVPSIWWGEVIKIIYDCPQHTFLILTKRPKRGAYVLPGNIWFGVSVENQEQADKRIPLLLQMQGAKRFVSVEPMLGPVNIAPPKIARPWGKNGASAWWTAMIDWVICGGESGPGARPMNPDWARSLRDQCKTANVPFFFKQQGEYIPTVCRGYEKEIRTDHGMYFRVGKKEAGRLLDGREWNEFPK